MGMTMITRAKKRKLEEERLLLLDRISDLSDDILCDIVSLLPTKAGARTQILSSRWRHVWRSAPLNLDLHNDPADGRQPICTDKIARVLNEHTGPPGHRCSVPKGYFVDADHAAGLDGWLQSPVLKNLQELEIYLVPSAPLPASVHRFSSSLRIASFGFCTMPDNGICFPVLEQMTLFNVRVSETSLHAFLAGCTVLQSLLLHNSYGFCRLRIVSGSLRSIGVRDCGGRSNAKLQLVVEEVPYLERLLVFEGMVIDVSLISAPRLGVLGQIFDRPRVPQFRSRIFQGSTDIGTMNVVHSVKVLALSETLLSLDAVIDTLKCFPHLEKLYIKATPVSVNNVWHYKYQKLIGTHIIRLRKIVIANYQGIKTQINFAKFFVSNARLLESIRLEVQAKNFSKAWVANQRSLLKIKRRASRGAHITFVSRKSLVGSLDLLHAEQVHDLSIDPFERFHQFDM